jgi:gallate decarboxylase subunit D
MSVKGSGIRQDGSHRSRPSFSRPMRRIRVARTRGSFRVVADALFIGDDLLVSISGGTHPHIGAVAMAVPRPSLEDPRSTSSTSSVLTRIGHKEDEIVKRVSEEMSSALGAAVVVTAGIHWENLSREQIETIRLACDEVVRALVQRVVGRRR